MARYATTEEMWNCWGCGFDIPLRSMWKAAAYPHTHRCPNCSENIVVDHDGDVSRAAAYHGPLEYVDLNDPFIAAMEHPGDELIIGTDI